MHRAISAGAFREGGRLSRWAALRSLLVTAKEIAGGMCLLHSYKVIHGDLSGSNIMLKASRVDKRGFVAKVGFMLLLSIPHVQMFTVHTACHRAAHDAGGQARPRGQGGLSCYYRSSCLFP